MSILVLSALSGVIMMFASFLLKQKSAVRTLALVLSGALVVVTGLELGGNRLLDIDTQGALEFDRFALVFLMVAHVSTFAYLLLSARDMEDVGVNYGDYFALIFFILAGIALTASFRTLLMLFLGIEILSIPLYILAGADKRSLKSNEAALKYFLMGSFSTGLMLMGIALIYGATGSFTTLSVSAASASTALAPAGATVAATTTTVPVLLIAGMLLLLFAISFKVSAAPFHFWTPDVYDGSPTVFTSYMATVVKAAGFIGFMRLFSEAFGDIRPEWKLTVALITAITLFIGNLTAVFQQSVKRMLAYSSIAQAGFMMLAVYALNADAREGLILYGAAYSLATIGIFGVLVKMKDYTFDGFNGFAKREPLVAGTLVVFLLSLAGIPLTAGFLSKFYMLRATLESGSLSLAIFAVLMAAVSVYYYFRLIQAMYFREGESTSSLELRPGFKATLVGLAAITILLGIAPELLTKWLYF